MNLTSPLPFFGILALLLGLGAVVARRVPFYRDLLEADAADGRRHLALDGLRGLLAPAVFLSHACTSHEYLRTGDWVWPRSDLYILAGQGPVVLFFMITGFLFWGRVVRGDLRALPHYRARLLRIMPLYGVLVGAMLAIVFARTGGRVEVPGAELARQLAELAIPGYQPSPRINGVATGDIMTMSWTLWYELVFYALLPLVALRSTALRWGAVLVPCAAAYVVRAHIRRFFFVGSGFYWSIFLFGMLAAEVVARAPRPAGPRGRRVLSAVAAVFLLAAFVLYPWTYNLCAYALLLPALVAMGLGGDLFGLLTSRAARLLGTVSYSVYLLHLVVLHVALRALDRITPVGLLSPEAYWAVAAAIAALVLGVSCATYRWVEHPFLRRRVVPDARPAGI